MIYKSHCPYQDFSPLANGLYLIVITNETPLRNGNCPITDPITEKGVAHTVGLFGIWIVYILVLIHTVSIQFIAVLTLRLIELFLLDSFLSTGRLVLLDYYVIMKIMKIIKTCSYVVQYSKPIMWKTGWSSGCPWVFKSIK